MTVHAHQLMTKLSPAMPPQRAAIVSVDPEASLADVARTMIEHRVHQVYVMERGIVEGVVTAFDLLRRLTETTDDGVVESTGYRR